MENNTARMSMNSIGSLFGDSWKSYKERFAALVEIMALPVLALALGYLLVFLGGLLVIAGIVIIIAGYVSAAVASIAMINAIHHGTNVDDSYKAAFKLFWPFVWIVILISFAKLGASAMLLIPGIWLSIATLFGPYLIIMENRRGIDALRQSKDYIKGYWWAVLGREILLVLAIAVPIIILVIPFAIYHSHAGFIVPLVIGLLSAPFGVIFNYKIVENLQHLRSDLAEKKTSEGTGFIKASAIVGIVVMTLYIVVAIAAFGIFIAYMAGHVHMTPPAGFNVQPGAGAYPPNPLP